jgi:hypothetical protein
MSQTLFQNSPTVRLAYAGSIPAMIRGLAPIPTQTEAQAPALLVSYVYLHLFRRNRRQHQFRNWVLDSGAFSAYNSGKEIRLSQYIDDCKRLIEEENEQGGKLVEIYSLDVIGDWRATLKNTEAMWKAGVEAIPCYHVGEPWEYLVHIAANYPKIALGGVALQRGKKKIEWAKQCFARAWPKRIHGFGFGGEEAIMALPWHSVDASTWSNPCRFGRWKAFGDQRVSVRGSDQNLRLEVEWYLKLEAAARSRWAREMEKLECLP